jgi:hypothetical protein
MIPLNRFILSLTLQQSYAAQMYAHNSNDVSLKTTEPSRHPEVSLSAFALNFK